MRIFIAVQLDNNTKSHLKSMIHSLEPNFIKARYTEPENYHITLQFIGDADKSTFNRTAAALKRASALNQSLTIFTEGTRSFRKGRKHIIYCSTAESSKLKKLQVDVCNELKKSGVEFREGKFTPHITLAREAVLIDEFPELSFQKQKINISAIHLMESTRINGKLTYISRVAVKLGDNKND